MCVCSSGEPVVVSVKLEREDEEEVSPYVIAPFFPQVCVCYVCTCAKYILSFLFLFHSLPLPFHIETRRGMVGCHWGPQKQ